MFNYKYLRQTVLDGRLPSSMSCRRQVIAWPAHEPPHDTLPWLHSTSHISISSWSNSWELTASDSVITGRVMPANRAVTYTNTQPHLQILLFGGVTVTTMNLWSRGSEFDTSCVDIKRLLPGCDR